ncbi:MAG: RnfABCDGE type electron transport complex subunit G [Candidatus Altiarchaeota archaeon]
MNNDVKAILTLVIICAASAAGLSVAYSITSPVIEDNRMGGIRSAQKEVMPAADTFKEISDEKIMIGGVKNVFEASSKDGNLIGYVIVTEAKGFQGGIRIIFGADTGGAITKVRILENVETPGLGSRINEEDFLKQFEGKAFVDDEPKVDAITGATISSSAVIESVKSGLNNTLSAVRE